MKNLHRPLHQMISVLLAASAAGCSAPPVRRPPCPGRAAAGDSALSPLYSGRSALPAKAGVMLRTETLPSQPEIASAAIAQRIFYTSTDARWNSDILLVSGTLYLPRGTAPA